MTLDAVLIAILSRWLDGTDIDRLELSGPDGTLTLARAGVAALQAPASGEGAASIDIRAPSLGVFLDRHPLAACPFVAIGDEVTQGDLLACLQVGALLMPVRAPGAGIVAARLAEPGALIGYGTPLFSLHPLHPGERP
jgi:acetyl-CoA carboxylase biotin carboxyl carrier protein